MTLSPVFGRFNRSVIGAVKRRLGVGCIVITVPVTGTIDGQSLQLTAKGDRNMHRQVGGRYALE